LRGYNWRGRDCSPLDAAVYPGRRSGTPGSDYDCNGISGFNSQTGKSWKEELCDGVPHLGVIGECVRCVSDVVVMISLRAAMGDSAGAHFSIPPKYMNASMIDASTFDDLLYVVSDEIDWPHLGGYTGMGTRACTPCDIGARRIL
jgi:acyloxyacyl hydrolase